MYTMNCINKSGHDIDNPDKKMIIQTVEKHFRFLVERHEFAYDGNFLFTSQKVHIELRIGHNTRLRGFMFTASASQTLRP
jgi:hypothetical protein